MATEPLPLSCADVRELIANELDRELTLPMRGRLRDHLARCESCRHEAATLAQSVAQVRAVERPESVAPWFAERTLGRLLDEFDAGDSYAAESKDTGQLELWR